MVFPSYKKTKKYGYNIIYIPNKTKKNLIYSHAMIHLNFYYYNNQYCWFVKSMTMQIKKIQY